LISSAKNNITKTGWREGKYINNLREYSLLRRKVLRLFCIQFFRSWHTCIVIWFLISLKMIITILLKIWILYTKVLSSLRSGHAFKHEFSRLKDERRESA
jgi:hypothetical protein